jgi:adenylosuccinate lyase
MQRLAVRAVRGKAVHPDRMHSNLDLTCGALLSQRVLLTLISSGLASDDA